MHAMLGTRPDVVCAVGFVSRFSLDSKGRHWSAIQTLLRYWKGARTIGIKYRLQIEVYQATVMPVGETALHQGGVQVHISICTQVLLMEGLDSRKLLWLYQA